MWTDGQGTAKAKESINFLLEFNEGKAKLQLSDQMNWWARTPNDKKRAYVEQYRAEQQSKAKLKMDADNLGHPPHL